MIDAHWELLQLIIDYRPSVLDQIEIILFKAEQVEESNNTIKNHNHNYWTNYSTNVKTYITPGNHETILDDDGALKIKSILAPVLIYKDDLN